MNGFECAPSRMSEGILIRPGDRDRTTGMSNRHLLFRSRWTAVLATASLALLATACGSSSASTGSDAATSAPKANQVQMKLIAFRPAKLTVKAGATVTWTQTDPGVHTVTSGTVAQDSGGVTPQPDGKFGSGQLATGKTFKHTFDTAGSYPYFCEIHPATMRGTITVR